MAKRDAHDVLGVQRGASPADIKAAWRRLARTNHPDLTGDDPAASRAATRRMAEINDAYAALSREAERDRREQAGERADFAAEPTIRRGGPPRARRSPPVTARVDMSSTYQPRNATTGTGPRATPGDVAGAGSANPARTSASPSGRPPMRGEQVRKEPPRASTPTGPMVRDRIAHFRRPVPPTLDAARSHVIEFGKFHGHSLGDIAAFEPSYIDWVAGTVTRDPDLVAAARVLQTDLDQRGVARRVQHTPLPAGRSA
ncbi:MAG: J domain-containing protein [Chloroflexi bacterium]|nr:J domain-containing protein [Chloroflexota bacterium]